MHCLYLSDYLHCITAAGNIRRRRSRRRSEGKADDEEEELQKEVRAQMILMSREFLVVGESVMGIYL